MILALATRQISAIWLEITLSCPCGAIAVGPAVVGKMLIPPCRDPETEPLPKVHQGDLLNSLWYPIGGWGRGHLDEVLRCGRIAFWL
jgi:hypothetical protein